MSPEAIRAYVSSHYSGQLYEKPRKPHGWSFFIYNEKGGASSNRIFRVISNKPNQPSHLKLAVTSRLKAKREFIFEGDEAKLKLLIDGEIKLYWKHSSDRSD